MLITLINPSLMQWTFVHCIFCLYNIQTLYHLEKKQFFDFHFYLAIT